MPRNNAGSYTLPPGTPFVTGTTISSSVVNSVDSDIGTEITNSLDRNGRGQMLAPLALSDGSATAPALTFNAETNSGLYRSATNVVGLQIGGNTVLQGTVTGINTLLGINATSSVANAAAFTGVGNGTGSGVVATGGSSGASGVNATGTGSSSGVTGTGGPVNGAGVSGTGAGAGVGVTATGGPSGGYGLIATPGATQTTAALFNGNIQFAGAFLPGVPNVSVSGISVTQGNTVRVGGSFSLTGAVGAQTLVCSYNVASVVLAANKNDLTVTFSNYTASSATSYWVTLSQGAVNTTAPNKYIVNWRTKATTSFVLDFYNPSTGALIDLTTLTGLLIDFEVKGF